MGRPEIVVNVPLARASAFSAVFTASLYRRRSVGVRSVDQISSQLTRGARERASEPREGGERADEAARERARSGSPRAKPSG